MKKIISLAAVFALLFCLVSCVEKTPGSAGEEGSDAIAEPVGFTGGWEFSLDLGKAAEAEMPGFATSAVITGVMTAGEGKMEFVYDPSSAEEAALRLKEDFTAFLGSDAFVDLFAQETGIPAQEVTPEMLCALKEALSASPDALFEGALGTVKDETFYYEERGGILTVTGENGASCDYERVITGDRMTLTAVAGSENDSFYLYEFTKYPPNPKLPRRSKANQPLDNAREGTYNKMRYFKYYETR